MLAKVGVQEEPVMQDSSYVTEYGCVMGVILSFGHLIGEKSTEAYPLIYFAALQVILRPLARLYKEQKDQRPLTRVEENLFSLGFRFLSFANAAIRRGNSRGAGLGFLEFKRAYEQIAENKIDNVAEDLIQALVEVGGNAAGAGDRLKEVDFLGKPLPDYVIDIIASASHKGKLSGAALEVLIKGEGDHEKRMAFLKKLGKTLQTNFGLNFDWRTGLALS